MQSLELKSLVRGRVLLPGEEGYDAERGGWNLIVEHHPEARLRLERVVATRSPLSVVLASAA